MKISVEILKKIPLVMISMSRWDGDFSSAAWSLAKTFAKNQPVIYVDYPFTLIDYWRERKTSAVIKRKKSLLYGKAPLHPLHQYGPNLFALTPPLMLPVNWLPEGRLYSLLSKWNDRRLHRSISKGLAELGSAECLFFNSFNPLYLSSLPSNFPATAFIYQSRDNIRALEPYLRKHGARAEITAVRNALLSIVTSRQLQADLTNLSGISVDYLPNAADFDTFRKAYEEKLDLPPDMEGITHPIIGYTGNICHRTDYDLLAAICKGHPDKNIVMVGPRNHWGSTSIDLDAIPNLHFVGPKPLERLPEFLAHFDVLILPFLCNEVTKSIYPLKINEYLASGKPVIATPFSEDILSFKGLIRLEKEHQAFVSAISEEMAMDTPTMRLKRYEEASKNTWDNRAAQIWKLLEEKIKHFRSEKELE
ncbi:glycosyltransferase [Lunatibacter salilacus]|uniref:glycosyltransferase n=1 Tax=Lunatibacter salilacus TaxID=2483804 RepID=UPI001F1F88AB|nr:glycosyltransferase [Lunatibacter salilacus]